MPYAGHGPDGACRPWPDIRSPPLTAEPLKSRNLRPATFKNIVLYDVSGPSAANNFILATLQNVGFYVVLGSRGGPGRENAYLEDVST